MKNLSHKGTLPSIMSFLFMGRLENEFCPSSKDDLGLLFLVF